MTDTEKRGRGCVILALVGLVGHLIVLRVIAGTAEPWETSLGNFRPSCSCAACFSFGPRGTAIGSRSGGYVSARLPA